MPTFEVGAHFWNDYARLRPEQQELFRLARQEFIAVLRALEAVSSRGIPQFPKSLGITPMVNHPNVMEMAWAPDGRCTWSYGTPQKPGLYHIVWRRIGTHAIYRDP